MVDDKDIRPMVPSYADKEPGEERRTYCISDFAVAVRSGIGPVAAVLRKVHKILNYNRCDGCGLSAAKFIATLTDLFFPVLFVALSGRVCSLPRTFSYACFKTVPVP
jgi:hypothetical protein